MIGTMISQRKGPLLTTSMIFVVIETVIFYLIHFSNTDPDYILHYFSVIIAVIFSWLILLTKIVTNSKEGKRIRDVIFKKDTGLLICIAMLFTLVADYFLVAKEEVDNLTGVTVFLGTQLFIFLHIFVNDSSRRYRTRNIITRIVLSVVLIFVAYLILGESIDRMSVIGVIYYANLCTNAIFAHRIKGGGIILTIGLILFALCDINVALSALDSIYVGGFPEGSMLYNLMHTKYDLIWIFYIPSQTLIPLSLVLSENI